MSVNAQLYRINKRMYLQSKTFQIGGVSIHAKNDHAFRWSCRNGHKGIAEWLLS